MWPFNKKKEVQDFSEYVKKLEEVPCGDKEVHYFWVRSNKESRSCPKCSLLINNRIKDNDQEKLAQRIAHNLEKLCIVHKDLYTIDTVKEAYIEGYYEGAGDDAWYRDHPDTKCTLSDEASVYPSLHQYVEEIKKLRK